ncbi:MAG: dihydroorotase, partial [Natrialbaceae archaeon]
MRFCNATLPDGRVRDLRIEGEIIVAVGEDLEQGNGRTIDATDKRLFPGAIDVHVHFREPGFSHKETWRTGSESAAAGGVTTVVDQPNTDPPTVDGPGFDEKARLAEASIVDYGLNGGVTEDWDPDSLFDRSLLALGEVFLADSTGDMGIDAELFAEAVGHAGREGVPVTVHAEDADLFDEHAHERAEADSGQGHGADAARWSDYRTPDAEAAAVEQACEV